MLMPGTPKWDLLYSGPSQLKESTSTSLAAEGSAELLSVDTNFICWGKVPRLHGNHRRVTCASEKLGLAPVFHNPLRSFHSHS